jgi:hypothetical protein
MDASSMMAASGAASMSPTSPVSSRHGHAHGNSNGIKRKRSSVAGIDSSPGSGIDDHDAEQEKKRQPGVKRACNECRQQKVSQTTLEVTVHSTKQILQTVAMRCCARPLPKLFPM